MQVLLVGILAARSQPPSFLWLPFGSWWVVLRCSSSMHCNEAYSAWILLALLFFLFAFLPASMLSTHYLVLFHAMQRHLTILRFLSTEETYLKAFHSLKHERQDVG